jgi:glutamyl-tRNA synthetase
MSVRVRYPPSPTGLQHIGGVRTALFNYLFAKSCGGTFVLRIEDTDQTRSTDEALTDLYETLEWLGLDWDEGPHRTGDYGPYIQSERSDLYRAYADELLEKDVVYRCFCTAERLDQLRKTQDKNTGYDRACRNLSEDEVAERMGSGESHVLRLKVPLEGTTAFDDFLLGTIKRKNKDISPDPILMKSDGLPTYHLANVIDDHTMEITHILRAQEWLPSVPIHIILYKAFGWTPPIYCHLPLVLGKDGQKLGKRHGSTGLREFREDGYLPETIINYLALLGWSFDDKREFFALEELEKLFSIEKINKAPATFDYKKLDWLNGQYIRKTTDDRLKTLLLPYLRDAGLVADPPNPEQDSVIAGMLPLVRERLRRLDEVAEAVRFLFSDLDTYETDVLVPKKLDANKTLEVLVAGREMVSNLASSTDEDIEEKFRGKSEELEVKLGVMLMPVRVAVTGTSASPPLFASIRLLGIDKALARIDFAINLLKEHTGG